jgi:hypothetical protein
VAARFVYRYSNFGFSVQAANLLDDGDLIMGHD